MIGIVVPAHNEEAMLDECIAALLAAAAHPLLDAETVHIHIVLDACNDGSEAIVQAYCAAPQHLTCAISYSLVSERNVGMARSEGASRLLQLGVRWLAFTDADTVVSPEWLAMQLSLGVDVVCGSVAVSDWSPHGRHAMLLEDHFHRTYNDADGHRHIHGANLGVSAAAYRLAGGFSALACHEDVALVAALESTGARFAWSAAPRVATSARTDARARGGFGDTILAVAATYGSGRLP
ncbi:glycosyltransferase [Undibacterium sp. TJN25]|uniref:glycosyltransferase n=1 Tax=Undibacterium sp. TJN25 TaxID=3413056 RepID=UPI003BF2E631